MKLILLTTITITAMAITGHAETLRSYYAILEKTGLDVEYDLAKARWLATRDKRTPEGMTIPGDLDTKLEKDILDTIYNVAGYVPELVEPMKNALAADVSFRETIARENATIEMCLDQMANSDSDVVKKKCADSLVKAYNLRAKSRQKRRDAWAKVFPTIQHAVELAKKIKKPQSTK